MEKRFEKWNVNKCVTTMFLVMVTIVLAFVPGVHAQEDVTPNIIRHEGYSRENVAENVAKEHFSDSNKVIIVNREKFPDAISATNISQGDYPVLYTRNGRVSDSTMELLDSMSLNEIYILGGELSIKPSVVNQLKNNLGVKVTRVAGRSRYDANVSAVEENFTQANHVVIASGEVYSDALYGVSYANTINAPVVLTKTNQLAPSTIDLLKDLNVKQATIIGGQLTVTPAVEKQLSHLGITHNRIAGRNRYIGSAEVAAESYPNPETVVIASGEVFSDALVSAPLAQKLDAPILLVRSNRVEEQINTYISNNLATIGDIYIQGGPKTIGYSILDEAIEAGTKAPEVTTETVVETEVVEYGVEYIDLPTKFEGYEFVEQEGVNGEKEVEYLLTYEDGELVSKEVVGERVTQQPVNRVVQRGTLDTTINQQEYANEMLTLVNNLRREVGVQELEYDSSLQQGADVRAQEVTEQFSHTRPDGSSFHTVFPIGSWSLIGENIASNYIGDLNESDGVTLEQYMARKHFDQYYNSQGHYDNMVNPEFTRFATSTAKSGLISIDNVQIFAR